MSGPPLDLGVLERIRAFEADVEGNIDSVVQQELFRDEVHNERHRILLDHFKVQQAQKVRGVVEKLLDAYLDEDDIIHVQEAPSEGEEVVAAAMRQFEARIADIREYHHTYRDLPPIRPSLEQPDPAMLERLFSPREHLGACIDFEPSYNLYSTFMITTGSLATDCQAGTRRGALGDDLVRWAEEWEGRLEYFRFVAEVERVVRDEVDANRKVVGFGLYRVFVTTLLGTLRNFYHRVYPLRQDLDRLLGDVETEAEEFWTTMWRERAVLQPVRESTALSASPHALATINDDEEAAIAGARRTRSGKTSAGLPVPPALRRFVKTFSLWPVEFVNRVAALRASTTGEDATLLHAPHDVAEVKAVCVVEGQICTLLQSLLFESQQQTERTLLREYGKTAEEVALDRGRAEQDFEQSLEAIRKKLSSSMETTVAHAAEYDVQSNLQRVEAQQSQSSGTKPGAFTFAARGEGVATQPMSSAQRGTQDEEQGELESVAFVGEDGKPLARWLVKLQQLEKTFVCEVCGGTVYRGPKVFREHFGAERHAEGLRRLGVTQRLKDYEGIAAIRLVIELRDKLQGSESSFRRRLREDEDSEEMQDGQGKVITMKDYKRFQRRRT